MKKQIVAFIYFSIILLFMCTTSCSKKDTAEKNSEDSNSLIIGFSQIGAESSWRACNTESIKAAAAESGMQLLYTNAEQKQEKQIMALRSFIAYQVDVIIFVPIVENGWDNVLTEAKEAGIPVIISDRKMKVKNDDLYAGFIGTDSDEEGRKAARFLLEKFKDKNGPVRIIEIRGTDGSSPTEGRSRGFREILEPYSKFKIIRSETGDFLRSRGRELMKQFLDDYGPIDTSIDVIYSHNDSMTLGVLDELEGTDILPGKDIVIVSIDAEQAMIDALREERVNCVVECNPHLGPQIIEQAKILAAGGTIPKIIHVPETVFTEYDDKDALPQRDY